MYAENLLGVTQNFLSPDIVGKFSRALGETTEKTQKAIKSVIPTLLMGIVDKGQTSEGAETLVNLVHRDGFEDETRADYNDANYLDKGKDAVRGIFGNNLDTVVSKLEDTTGIDSSGVDKMMDMAAPLVMGALGKKMQKEAMSTSGLMGFLSQQKSSLAGLVPEGLVGRLSGATSAGPSNISTGVGGGLKPSRNLMGRSDDRKRSPWVLISFIVLAVLAFVWWFTGKRYLTSAPDAEVTSPMEEVTEGVSDIAPATATALGIGGLAAFMEAGATELPKRFQFETLTFEAGTSSLGAGAEAELDQIAKTMMDYPEMTARIEGYTDNTGMDDMNESLSSQRAEVVKNELVSRGVEANRLEAIGLGSTNPVATNETEEGRALNRRIEFVVTGAE